MALRSLLGLIRDRWKLIILVTLLAGAVSSGLTARAARTYSSSLTFLVSAQVDSANVMQAYQAGLLSQQKLESYANLLTGPMLAAAVVKTGELKLDAPELQSRISAKAVPQTVLLRATVTGDSPAQAQKIARVIAVVFPQQISQLERPETGGASTVVIRVVAQPSYSSEPVSPKPVRNLAVGLALGLLAGLGLAAIARTLDTSLKTAEQVAHALGGKPVLGAIPYDPAARGTPVLYDADLVGSRMEAFRKLRIAFGFVQVDAPRKVIMFTSAMPHDGKSTTVCNLAAALGTAGTKAIIVECDLRRPQVGRYLGLPNGAGLTDILLGRASLDDAIQTWGDDDVDVLTSGTLPPNPGDLLGSQRMERLIEELRSRYEVVLLDLPPTLAFADAAAAGRHCDGAIVVARHGRTRVEQLRRVVESLTAAGTPVLAGVLCMAPQRRDTDGGWLYGYRYYQADKPRGYGARVARARAARTRTGAAAPAGGRQLPGSAVDADTAPPVAR
ncbi:polysaccharide biosynthesis tyrosine autokinase [Kitasatospora sp. NPDC085895]|uniref:polysaccharide biosynthesis tyrosine autokinase n=1 Tax=Kitasatospora sp. NPDC085895 TaxID=3155057 RepID=UPI00345019E8